jgi:SAM-dependent methyltransferase
MLKPQPRSGLPGDAGRRAATSAASAGLGADRSDVRSRRPFDEAPAAAGADLSRQFDAVAGRWDAEHGAGSTRGPELAARIQFLRLRCRDLGRPRVLDLGCATGQMLLRLSDLIETGVGVDISPAMIGRAQQMTGRQNLRFEIDDIVHFCTNCRDQFDLVLLIGVIEHLPSQPAALASIRRVLAASGRLIILSPHPWNPLFRLKRLIGAARDEPPAHHPSPLRLRRIAGRSGLELTAMDALPYAPWPALRKTLSFGNSTVARKGKRSPRDRSPLVGMLPGAFAAEFVPTRRRGRDGESMRAVP